MHGFLAFALIGPLYALCALICVAVVVYVIAGLYALVKMAVRELYYDWCDMRAEMRAQGARIKAAGESPEPGVDGEDGRDGLNGSNATPPRQPALAEAIGAIRTHPSMDGLSTGDSQDTVVTRFTRPQR